MKRWQEYLVCVEFGLPGIVKEYDGTAEALIQYPLSRNTFQLESLPSRFHWFGSLLLYGKQWAQEDRMQKINWMSRV